MHYPHHKLTVSSEKMRVLFIGPFAALQYSQFLLYVALGYFNAPEWGKSLVVAALGMGMLINPVIVEVLNRFRLPVSKAVACTIFTAAGSLLPAVFIHEYSVFLPCVIISFCLMGSLPAMVTAMWQNNVPPEIRGRFFSQVCLLGSISALLCGGILAGLLRSDGYLRYYYLILGVVAAGMIVAGRFVWRIPGKPPQQPKSVPYSALKLLKQDKLFAYICAVWFLLGVGNLSTVPLRMEYIASSKYGLEYSGALVLLIMQIIPQSLRLASTLIWGKIFDHMNFIFVRVMINVFFFLSIVLFFFPPLYCQIIGMICFGIANGGGEVIWNLWVTKVAPEQKTGDYMSVHVFLCGIRAVAAPFIGYSILNALGFNGVTVTAAGLIAFSSIMFLPLIRHPRLRSRKSTSQPDA